MAALRINILSNYIGQVWMVVMGIIFMPIYMRLLGMEAFGLVGIMLTFQSLLQLFDFGIGTTANRELSRYAHHPKLIQQCRNLVRTAEIIIWIIAIVIILFFYFLSYPISEYWLNVSFLTPSQVAYSIFLIGVAIALFWPSTFYANCLLGLEQQPVLNLIQVVFTTLRFAGVIPVLYYIAPTIENFLYWYIFIGILQSFIMFTVLFFYLPKSEYNAKFNPQLLLENKKFAGGIFVISILSLSVGQIDRFILTSLRPLEEMGYYTLAISIAAGIGRMVQPMFNAIYPRFTRLVARNDLKNLIELYHLSSQYLSVVIASSSLFVLFFAHEILFLWTSDIVLSERVTPVLQFLIIGTIFNGLMNIPYALQLAYSWTKLTILLNFISIIIVIPLCIFFVNKYGLLGAVIPWVVSNFISFIIGMPLMHKRFLSRELIKWYLKDNFPAFFGAFLSVYMLKSIIVFTENQTISFIILFFSAIFTLIVCCLFTSVTRKAIYKAFL